VGKTVRPHDVLISAAREELPEAVAGILAASTTDEVLPGEAAAVDAEAATAILSRNGDWDAAQSLLAHPSATDVPVWYLRGEPASGGLIPDEVVPDLARRVGADHVLTIAGASHSPIRSRQPEAVTMAILHALEGSSGNPGPPSAT
jgi:hypothetical protein